MKELLIECIFEYHLLQNIEISKTSFIYGNPYIKSSSIHKSPNNEHVHIKNNNSNLRYPKKLCSGSDCRPGSKRNSIIVDIIAYNISISSFLLGQLFIHHRNHMKRYTNLITYGTCVTSFHPL